MAARKAGSASPLPWCGTLSTSARRSTPLRRRRASAVAPRSPVSRMDRPRAEARTTSDRSFAVAEAMARAGSGASTSRCTGPTVRRSPGTSTVRCAPERATSRSRSGSRSSAGDSVPVATMLTWRPASAPARPPTWSASRCEAITSGRAEIPRRWRHRSAAGPSGPASTSTPAPGAVGSTMASPCPTSHTTASVFGGGQLRSDCRRGQPRVTSPTSAASASGRSRRNRSRRTTSTSSTAASPSAPPRPAGQAVAASGREAAPPATRASQAAGHPASQTATSAAGDQTGAATAAASPSRVTGGTAGAARRFAGTEIQLTVPERPATSGAVASPAAALTAIASASSGQHPRCRSARDQPGATRTIAAVATTDSAKPGSVARLGSTTSRTPAAAARAGTAARERPAARARRVTAPMTAARITLGVGRASTTNAPRASTATTACTRRSTARRRSGRSTQATTIATLAPDTAVRWLRPASRNSSSSTGSRARTSPTARPGTSPADRGSSTRRADPSSPSRMVPAAVWIGPGPPISSGGPRADRTATTWSPSRGGAAATRTRAS